MKPSHLIFLLIAPLSLYGCSTETTDEDYLMISEFYVIGTNDNYPSEIAVIDPYIRAGEFDVFMKVTKPDLGYIFNLYASGSKNTQDGERIFDMECLYGEICHRNDYLALGCTFFPDLTGECANSLFDLSSLFTHLPYSGYLIAEVCNRVQSQCVTKTAIVYFR